jgi:hypothetical protein
MTAAPGSRPSWPRRPDGGELESAVDPAVLVRQLSRALLEAPADWDPYRSPPDGT